jgi:hypothetical protein
MRKIVTLRVALPAIVILTIITIAVVAFTVVTTHATPGAAWGYPA